MGHINIASLNIKGSNSPSTINKWKMISNLASKNNITIMCMVESHSDDNLIETLNKKYNPRMSFIHTHDQEKPKTKGITVLMNTPLTNSLPSNIQIIVPGHAIQFSIQWPHQSTLTILAVYTLNPPNANYDFW